MEMIDLRSDTVTQPTDEMREAISRAVVGDDVFCEDPSINRLQEIAAEMTGFEAGLFVASGTMGNLTAILAHCQRGDEIIVGNKSHIFLFEAGGVSALGGIHSCQLPNQDDGSLSMQDLYEAIRSDDHHEPVSRLIALENTHNRCGGTYQTLDYTNQVCEFAHAHGLLVHMDGARIFNAAIANNIPVKQLIKNVDSVSFCLSKGLCSPVGSIVCGSSKFIDQAHRIRKMLGGGMRQAGIMAAAGIISLQKMVERLMEDHIRASRLATGLKGLPGILVEYGDRSTNMVFLSLLENVKVPGQELCSALEKKGIRVGLVSQNRIRMVVHYWIGDEEIEKTIGCFKNIMI